MIHCATSAKDLRSQFLFSIYSSSSFHFPPTPQILFGVGWVEVWAGHPCLLPPKCHMPLNILRCYSLSFPTVVTRLVNPPKPRVGIAAGPVTFTGPEKQCAELKSQNDTLEVKVNNSMLCGLTNISSLVLTELVGVWRYEADGFSWFPKAQFKLVNAFTKK